MSHPSVTTTESLNARPYAVFLSYNGKDRESVEKVAIYLEEEAQLRPWFDQWSLIPGDPWVRGLEYGLQASCSCAVFVGANGLGPWEQPEVELALRQQIRNREFRVIPVLLPDAPAKPNLPSFLEGNTWVDFRKGLEDSNALWRLEAGIRGISPERGPQPRKSMDVVAYGTAEIDLTAIEASIAPSTAPVRVFVSYRHTEPDSSLARSFADALTLAGHEVFIDTGIRWGSDWVARITQALEKSEFLVLLLSKESGTSEFLVEEVEIAKNLATKNGLPIILPIRLAFPFSEPLPYQLDLLLHNIHQEKWEGQGDTERLVKQLLTTINHCEQWPEAGNITPSRASDRISKPTPFSDPRDLIIPGGSIEASSRFYISRVADDEVFGGLQHPRALVTVRGPRQAGKTSVLMRSYVAVRCGTEQVRTVFIDFQALAIKDFKSLNSIWQAITIRIAAQLQLDYDAEKKWKQKAGYDNNTSVFLDQEVFRADASPLLICLDEIDSVFNSPVKAEFFGSLRAFFNRGAFDPSWKKVRWLLGSSSEPSFFIEDLTQSPFTIGLRVDLNTFTSQEVGIFARRHGLSLDRETLAEIMDYVGGRPYLVHLLLYHLVRNASSGKEMFNSRLAGKGIFKDHLHRYLAHFRLNKALANAMLSVLKRDEGDNPRLTERLEAAGLVKRDEALKVVPMCRLYAEFFKEELK